jgi:CRP/FNR family transcriptional regulator
MQLHNIIRIPNLLEEHSKVTVELGMGDGRLLEKLAKQDIGYPSCIYIGIELDKQHYEDAKRRINLNNVKLLNDSFENIYAVRTGSLKTIVLNGDGREQITGFQMAGELLGLDGIGMEKHICAASALEDSQLCVIPFKQLEKLCRESPAVQHHMHKIMSNEIVREHKLLMLLGNMRTEERLAIFLLDLSQRLQARGYSAREFYLRMTREDIGNYLGMKLETVSRIFSRFQKFGLISVQQKQIAIIDMEGLRRRISH